MPTSDCFVFDLDGVLVDSYHRLHQVKNGMEAYFKNMDHDRPNPAIQTVISVLHREFNIYLMTGRTSIVKDRTKEWLAKHHIPYDNLFMRPSKYDGPIAPLKCMFLEQIVDGGESIRGFFDDNPNTVNLAREKGFNSVLIHSGYYDILPPEEDGLW